MASDHETKEQYHNALFIIMCSCCTGLFKPENIVLFWGDAICRQCMRELEARLIKQPERIQ